MRSRDEVLREFSVDELARLLPPVVAEQVHAMADRIRELEAQRDEYHKMWDEECLINRDLTDQILRLEAQQAASEPVAITDEMVEAGCREHYEYTTGLRWDDANSTVQYMWRKDARIMLIAALTAASEGASEAKCEHSWISMQNQYIESGEICTRCFAIHPTTPTRGSDE